VFTQRLGNRNNEEIRGEEADPETLAGNRVIARRYGTKACCARHCNNIAISSAKGAEEARAIAEHHRMLAKEAAKVR
jgi:hypothetical protein